MSAKRDDVQKAKAQKKDYRKPRLVTHGDIRAITKAKGGSASDGTGKPRTKSPTGPGA
jgi:hypothetical protein